MHGSGVSGSGGMSDLSSDQSPRIGGRGFESRLGGGARVGKQGYIESEQVCRNLGGR